MGARPSPGTGRSHRGTETPVRALLAARDPAVAAPLAALLEAAGCRVERATPDREAIGAALRSPFDLLLCAVEPSDPGCPALVARLHDAQPGADLVVAAAGAAMDAAIEAIRRGATDYVPLPLTGRRLRELVESAAAHAAVERMAPDPELQIHHLAPAAVIERLLGQAGADGPVLLRGEEGSGTLALARALHAHGRRPDVFFAAVSCRGARPDELEDEIERALGSGGPARGVAPETLLLEDVDALPAALQERLAAALESVAGPADGRRGSAPAVRVVATTGLDLATEADAGRFRRDLGDALLASEIRLPPLRERLEAIVPLARSFAAFFAGLAERPAPELSPAARRLLVAWPWPGNVRELRRAVERAMLLSPDGVIDDDAFPAQRDGRTAPASVPGAAITLDEIEREHALRVLAWTSSLAEAASVLGLGREALRRRLGRWRAGAGGRAGGLQHHQA